MLLARWRRFSSPTVTTVGVVLMGVPTKYCTSPSERPSKKDLTNLLPDGAPACPKLSLLHANELSEGNKVILVGVRNGTIAEYEETLCMLARAANKGLT